MPICKPTHLIYNQSYVCNGVFFVVTNHCWMAKWTVS
jgi:hypothetical protein